ncbi:MAG: hypothetical protein EPO39_05100 [Candidatus Manganitrophaceae bacterium]|nr:MAG: hypothetical protein EPO39_05100 [Candidatus Manganitrophaceae bacterium]
MFESIGFGWVVLLAFLFTNLIWGCDMALNPPPRTTRKKQAPRRTKPSLKKMAIHSPLPIARLRRSRVGEPIAQPIP